MPFVLSKLANDVAYPINESKEAIAQAVKSAKILPKTKKIIIAGGTGVMQKNLETPDGVSTSVTEDELQALLKNTSFKRHKDRGFLKIIQKETDSKKAVDDMADRDKADQLVDSDFQEDKKPQAATKPKKTANKPKKTKKKI